MHPQLTSPAVLVNTANQQLACLIAADLAGRGVRVEATFDHPLSPCRFSRHFTACHPAPPASSGEAYVEAVQELAKSRRIDLFLPSCRDAIDLAPFSERLRAEAAYPFPALDMMRRVVTKPELGEAAREAGLPAPASVLWDGSDAAFDAASELRLPVVCKPADGFGGSGFQLLEDATRLEQRLAKLDPSRLWLLQEFVPGPLMVWMGIRWKGRLRASFAFVAEKTTPAFGGSSVLRRSVIDAALDRSSMRLLDYLDYEGFCTLDYVRDTASGLDYLIDFNPRFGTSLHAAAAAGVSFPHCLLQLVLGKPFEPPEWQAGALSSSLAGHIGRLVRTCPRRPSRAGLLLDAARAFCRPRAAEEAFRHSPVLMLMPFFNLSIAFTPGLRCTPATPHPNELNHETADPAGR